MPPGEARAPAERSRATAHGTAPAPAPVDAIGRINGAFHAAYDARRASEEAALGNERPFVVLRGGAATLHYAGKELRRPIFNPRYQSLKGLTHVAVAAASLLSTLPPGTPSADAAARIQELRSSAEGAEREVPRAVEEPALVLGNRRLLAATTALLDEARVHGAPGEERLRAYGNAIRADVTANLTAAAGALLDMLDAAVREMERVVAPSAWADVVVVIATAHQARAREVSVLYFERLLGERMGEGALGEQRLIVTEGPLEHAPPRTLVAAHLVDQRLSRLLFDDPLFLQSDVLGKFAAEHLERVLAARPR